MTYLQFFSNLPYHPANALSELFKNSSHAFLRLILTQVELVGNYVVRLLSMDDWGVADKHITRCHRARIDL